MRDWIRSLHGGQVVLLEVAIGVSALVLGVAVLLLMPSSESGFYALVAVLGSATVAAIALPWLWLSSRQRP